MLQIIQKLSIQFPDISNRSLMRSMELIGTVLWEKILPHMLVTKRRIIYFFMRGNWRYCSIKQVDHQLCIQQILPIDQSIHNNNICTFFDFKNFCQNIKLYDDSKYFQNSYNFSAYQNHMSDFSLTTFAAKGKLPQIQNALAAVAKGQTALGIKAKNGVVIATQKKLASSLMDETSYYKTQIFCDHIGAVYSGLGPDFRLLSQKARKLVQQYFVKYYQPVGVSTLCRQTSELVQQKTQAGGYRPFGISVLVAGYDESGPHLTQIDPSGAYYNWKATAIGKNAKNAKMFLEKRYKVDMQIQDAIHTALMTLKQGFQGQMDNTNIEVAVVREDKKFTILTPTQVKEYLDELQ